MKIRNHARLKVFSIHKNRPWYFVVKSLIYHDTLHPYDPVYRKFWAGNFDISWSEAGM